MTYRNTDDAMAGIRSIAQDRLRRNPQDGEAAVLLGLVGNAERRHFEEVTALRLALDAFVDDEPCRLDHHGICQAHGIDKPCSVATAKALLTGPLSSDWMRLWDAASEAFMAYLHGPPLPDEYDAFEDAMSNLGQSLAEHKAKWAPA